MSKTSLFGRTATPREQRRNIRGPLSRVRQGDEQAAADLVRRYEQQIRRVVRISEGERFLADRRAEGYGWPEIAVQTGEQANALRRRAFRGR